MSIFDPCYDFTVFDRYYTSNIAWGYFELKQMEMNYSGNKKIPLGQTFASLKTFRMLETNKSIEGQLGNFSIKKIKLSDYKEIDKSELFRSIVTFINAQRNFNEDSLDERQKRWQSYFKTFLPDIEYKINQLVSLDIKVFKLEIDNRNKLTEFPIYEYFQHYLIEYNNENLCAVINLGYD